MVESDSWPSWLRRTHPRSQICQSDCSLHVCGGCAFGKNLKKRPSSFVYSLFTPCPCEKALTHITLKALHTVGPQEVRVLGRGVGFSHWPRLCCQDRAPRRAVGTHLTERCSDSVLCSAQEPEPVKAVCCAFNQQTVESSEWLGTDPESSVCRGQRAGRL